MSVSLSHKQQISANQEMAKHLKTLHADSVLGSASRQWCMTLYFYMAVHHVEEQLQNKMFSPSSSHAVRKKNIRHVWGTAQSDAVLGYMDLETHSRETRYDGMVPTDQDLADAESQLNDVLTCLV